MWLTAGDGVSTRAPVGFPWGDETRGRFDTSNDYFALNGIAAPAGEAFELTLNTPAISTEAASNGYGAVSVYSDDGQFQSDHSVMTPVVVAQRTSRPGVLSARVSGPDRYATSLTALRASQLTDSGGARDGTLYVASGDNFP